MARLSGKVAFITGAAGGIGRSTCARYIAEGARIVAADISGPALDETLEEAVAGENGLALVCDITDPEQVKAAMAKTVSEFGRLDILCNIAGGSSSADARVTEAPDEEFWRVIKLDLYGTFLCSKYAIPEMVRSGGGAVVNLSSMVALMALPERDCYTAAKGGVAAMTRSMAVEYAPDNIRVNAIAPGLVLTPRAEALLQEREELRRLAGQHLLGPCRPLDIADMAVYLGSDEARVVTGQVISVDSGVTIS
ncbi:MULTISPECIES: SDR family NAD(P)-dependent oxidoreductase [Hyphomicrobiales]|jgi:NAD(P)-dependent dehydrogenase (short-subunit alcohol dehydrogenase family)|uniref:SDR family NAD(P)-dependent oxidoreductase n=2 Tax=Bosea TaxID=85413 RepID=A0ABW0IWV3_9HYPH|nr:MULTISPECIES: SDR family oxidoreductase [Hyphomicrobiales]AYO86445.1 SDR family oxidoreductase [Methylobacterium brachiatum]TAJ30061.1 MAG: SDR family oxidoreductase [Bosea sp. (in: a-proteobacteria)]